MRPALHSVIFVTALLEAAVLSASAGGCGYGESGVPPPPDRIVLPTGIVVDPESQWLYAVSSNSDLRHNAGTVTAISLAKAKEDRGRPDWGACPSAQFVPTGAFTGRFCCRDYFDRNILNCDERGYVDGQATAHIGSFGGAIAVQTFERGGEMVRRLFVAVRAEPSITVIEALVRDEGVTFRCTDDPTSGPNPLCDDGWKVRAQAQGDGEDEEEALTLPEEPFALALDEKLGILYVGHMSRGSEGARLLVQGRVTVIDACTLAKPTLAQVVEPVFADPGQGVTSLTISEPGDPRAPVFVTGRFQSAFLKSAEVQSLHLRGAEPCVPGQASAPREIQAVPGRGFYSSAFYPAGRDIRGLVLSPDKSRAYLLHRNPGSREHPPAIVAVDRRPDERGEPVNQAIDTVEVCGGGTEMRWHDSGRGPRLFVVCFESGQVYVVDPELMAVRGIINIGRGPASIAFAPGDPHVAYVAAFTDNNVSVLDLQPGSPTELRVVQRIGFPRVLGR
jgi:hypothetical protein